ncbi:MAG: excinuclease ABC subunit UvrC [Rhodospirillales bacterium]
MSRIDPVPKTAPNVRASLVEGAGIVETHLKTLPGLPGVYRMINAAGDVLYVGKAKNLKKRVSSYVQVARLSNRLRRMVAETKDMEFITTHTEAEALLLEANLIKRYTPRYNILLRDDKSFPSILVTDDHEFPQILKHRGARKQKGQYFGPFASAGAVNHTLNILQRAFLLRTCNDAVFESRTRPCLLYQIKRCSAPCVGRIGKEDYETLVAQARDFLLGKGHRIQREFAAKMQAASEALDYEAAAEYRDRIQALTRVQARQEINPETVEDADVIAAYQAGGQTCVQVFFFRSGRNYGNRAYFPAHARDEDVTAVLEAFIGQFYTNKVPPEHVLLSHRLKEQSLVADALSVHGEKRVSVTVPQRGEKKKLVEHVLNNAREALSRRLNESATQRKLLEDLARVLDLDGPPQRIEVYDNSHTAGAQAVGAMIVAGPDGMIKNAYRKFNIRGDRPSKRESADTADTAGLADAAQQPFTAGDDYAMMREVLTRRFSRALKEDPDRQRGQWPSLVLIDGGAGQLSAALDVFAELGIDDIAIAAIAKGPERNAGHERIFMPGRSPFALGHRDPVQYFIQRLRDEAHRFAIGTHRARRSKSTGYSTLDDIPGIGAKRKKALLHHFGSAQAVAEAGLADLEVVEGISKAMAHKLYERFHSDR